MNSKIKRIYVPMTESGFYILFCLQQPQHGYGISQQVRQMTGGELIISAGTMYGTLSKMEKDGLIDFEREEEKRKLKSFALFYKWRQQPNLRMRIFYSDIDTDIKAAPVFAEAVF